jgi:NADH:ubiquinone oxidoreductase subunit D
MNEMSESLNIINQVIYKIIKFKIVSSQKKVDNNLKNNFENSVALYPHSILKYLYPNYLNYKNLKNNYSSMEDLIKHFKY